MTGNFELRGPRLPGEHARHRLHAVVGDRREPGARVERSRTAIAARRVSTWRVLSVTRRRSGGPAIGPAEPPLARGILISVSFRLARPHTEQRSRHARAARSDGTSRTSSPAPECGAVATFVGLVRDHNPGRRFSGSTTSVTSRWRSNRSNGLPPKRRTMAGRAPGNRHRVGRSPIGEASVVIAAASPHRAERLRRAATPSSASSRSPRSGSTSTSMEAKSGSRAPRRIRRRGRAKRTRSSARARNHPPVCAAAGDRRRRRAGARDCRTPATASAAWEALTAEFPALAHYSPADLVRRQRGICKVRRRSRKATKSRSCLRFRVDECRRLESRVQRRIDLCSTN